MTDTDTETHTLTNVLLREPPLMKIIYLNDDQTALEFVVDSLIKHFAYTPDTAQSVTVNIHESGSAVVAVLPYEIAEQKGIEITVSARSEGYPLQIKLEPDAA